MFFTKSDIPSPTQLEVGFSLDANKVHTFALVWKLDSSRKTIRYAVEFSVNKRTFYAVPDELCAFRGKRVDIPFAEVVRLMSEQKLDITKHRYIYWRLTAEFHDTEGKSFGQSKSGIAEFEMPELE